MNDNEKDLQQETQDIVVDTETAVDDTLENRDGINYETSNNWKFEAEAPSLKDDISVESDEFEISLDSFDSSFLEEDGVEVSVPSVDEEPDEAITEVLLEDAAPEADSEQTTAPDIDQPIAEAPKSGEFHAVEETVEENDENKKNKKNKKAAKIAAAVVALLAICAVLCVFGVRYFTVAKSGEGKHLNPGSVVATVDKTKVSVGMFDYYYSSMVSYYESYASYGYYNLDTTKDYAEQMTTDDDGNEVSWAEFFRQEALEEIKNTAVIYNEAVKKGITLTDSQKKIIDEQIDSLKTTASEQTLSLDQYISNTFGKHCTEDTLRLVLEQYYVTANYRGSLAADSQPTQEDIDKYYSEHSDEYKSIKFSFIAIQYDTQDEKAKTEAVKKAEAYMPKMKDEASVKALVPEAYADFIDQYVTETMQNDEKISKADAEKEAIEYFAGSTIGEFAMNDCPLEENTTRWLFDDATKVGSTKYYIDEDYGYIYVILKTNPATVTDEQTYTVRHILVVPDGVDLSQGAVELTDEQMKNAKEKAEKILKEFNDGDKTEYSFALLAERDSEDTASTSAGSNDMFGGLYEGVTKGAMVPTFEEWSLDKSRKYGDTGIVESTYGCHIMFFVRTCPAYEADIISALRTQQSDDMVANSSIKINDSVVDKAIASFYKAREEAATEETSTEDTNAADLSGDEAVYELPSDDAQAVDEEAAE